MRLTPVAWAARSRATGFTSQSATMRASGAERDARDVIGERDAAGADERDPYHRALLYPSALALQSEVCGHRHDHRTATPLRRVGA